VPPQKLIPNVFRARVEAAMSEKHDKRDTPKNTPNILRPLAAADKGTPPTDSTLVRVDLAAVSHQGLVRPNNEDHYLVLHYGRTFEKRLTNLPSREVPDYSEEVGYAMLVADGMGGAVGGEVASQLALVTLLDLLISTPDWIFGTGDQLAEQVERRLAARYRQVDATLRREAEIDPRLSGMGTTMTVARSVSDWLIIGHIGDSRAYLLRQGTLRQLTKDHTLVQCLVDAGQATPEEAGTHPLRHALTRCLGGPAGTCEADPDVLHIQLADNDQLLLCTDGLTDIVDAETITSILGSTTSAKRACNKLVKQALKNGGRDNVTVVLARYRLPQAADAVRRRLPGLRWATSWWHSFLRRIVAAFPEGD
jgi:protein phosphatase